MMTATETESEELEKKETIGDTAVLEVSSMATSGLVKPDTRGDPDFLSNYSTSVEGSVVASPSIDSFSTLAEQDTSDFQMDSRELQVKVDNPQKHLETLETYITFRVTTRTSMPEFDESEYVVRRRYNDFIWLHQKLVETYPTLIIPPMPGKHSLLAQLDRYSKEFILARMKLLHIFLNRVINHPIFSCDQSLRIFLTAKPAEFSIVRKNRGNVLVKMTDSLPNMASVYTMKQRNLEFEQVRDYCNALVEKLSTIDKINCRIHKERQDYVSELRQMQPIFSQWAGSEPELEPILLAISKAILCNALAHQKLLDVVPNEEREYIAYVEAVKDALSRRDTMQIEYELTIEELSKRRLEKDQVMSMTTNGASSMRGQGWSGALWKAESRDEKLERLGQTIPRLAKHTEVLQDLVECANESLRSDLERWSAEKQNDLKGMLINMADRQIEHYQQCMSGWEEILAGLKFDSVNTEVNVGTSTKIPV